MKKNLVRIVLGAALAVGLTLPMSTASFADRDWTATCHQRLEHDKARLDHDVARYGPDSRRADRDRDRLADNRQWCRDHHTDWDHSRFDFGIYIKH